MIRIYIHVLGVEQLNFDMSFSEFLLVGFDYIYIRVHTCWIGISEKMSQGRSRTYLAPVDRQINRYQSRRIQGDITIICTLQRHAADLPQPKDCRRTGLDHSFTVGRWTTGCGDA